MKIFEVIIIAIVFVFILIFLYNQLHKKKKKIYTLVISILIAGMIIYGHGYFAQSNNIIEIVIAIFKTLRANIRMFAGADQFADIKNDEIYSSQVSVLIFWIIHVLALALSINALLLSFGKFLLVEINNFIALHFYKKNIYIFYKYNDNGSEKSKTIETIKRLPKSSKNIKEFLKNNLIIILDKNKDKIIEKEFDELILKNKCVILDGDIENNKKLLRVLNSKSYCDSDIKIFILSDDIDENYENSKKIYNLLIDEQCKEHNKISLTILLDDQYDISKWQSKNGFDFIRSLNVKDIIARELVKEYPPCDYVKFNNCVVEKGEEFNCLIIGIGELGSKIFKRLFIYSQFVGCKKKFKIVDENYDDVCAQFNLEFDYILDQNIKKDYQYLMNDITIDTNNEFNARSNEFYKYINENAKKLDYIVCATSSAKTNNEIVKILLGIRNKYNAAFSIFDCLQDRIFAYKANDDDFRDEMDIYDYLIDDKIDMSGKLIYYSYCMNKGKNSNLEDIIKSISAINPDCKDVWTEVEENWRNNECTAYDKNSSICSAEFYKTVLKVIGSNMENESSNDILKEISEEKNKEKEYYLSELEHNRWSAFMLTEGYRLMTKDEWNKRAKMYKLDKRIKIQNDSENKKHACLISYKDLKELNNKQKEITNSDSEYSKTDFRNVLMSVKIAEIIAKKYEN